MTPDTIQRQHPDTWEVVDHDNDNHRPASHRSEAEEMQATAEDFGSDDVEILPPQETDGGEVETVDAEVVDHAEEYQLDERSVAEDPIDWVPSDFTDEIDGSIAINRKGFEVLSHFYDIDVDSEVVVAPEETDHEYCRVTATATTPDGRQCVAHGSAHVDRDDDHYLLLEMADTRARKRSLSIATGVGAVAVAELRNEVTDDA